MSILKCRLTPWQIADIYDDGFKNCGGNVPGLNKVTAAVVADLNKQLAQMGGLDDDALIAEAEEACCLSADNNNRQINKWDREVGYKAIIASVLQREYARQAAQPQAQPAPPAPSHSGELWEAVEKYGLTVRPRGDGARKVWIVERGVSQNTIAVALDPYTAVERALEVIGE